MKSRVIALSFSLAAITGNCVRLTRPSTENDIHDLSRTKRPFAASTALRDITKPTLPDLQRRCGTTSGIPTPQHFPALQQPRPPVLVLIAFLAHFFSVFAPLTGDTLDLWIFVGPSSRSQQSPTVPTQPG